MTRVIGIDCATERERIGVAVADVGGEEIILWEVLRSSRVPSIPSYIAQRAQGARRVLLSLDAPLGWPLSLGTALQNHKAGEPIELVPDHFFSRQTDRDIRARMARLPPGVRTSPIGRTTHSALELLEAARRKMGQAVPLAWASDFPERAAAIEVHPTATLLAHGYQAEDYRGRHGAEVRVRLVKELARKMDVRGELAAAEHHGEVLDALVCVLAAADFLAGRAVPPTELPVAHKEGWIWAPARE